MRKCGGLAPSDGDAEGVSGQVASPLVAGEQVADDGRRQRRERGLADAGQRPQRHEDAERVDGHEGGAKRQAAPQRHAAHQDHLRRPTMRQPCVFVRLFVDGAPTFLDQRSPAKPTNGAATRKLRMNADWT